MLYRNRDTPAENFISGIAGTDFWNNGEIARLTQALDLPTPLILARDVGGEAYRPLSNPKVLVADRDPIYGATDTGDLNSLRCSQEWISIAPKIPIFQ